MPNEQRMMEITKAALLDSLWTARAGEIDARPFALLDAARDAAIYPALLEADCAWCSLYRGESAQRLADSAPYLVQLDWQSRFTLWLLETGWGRSWGVFLTSSASSTALRHHFRRLLMVQLPDGRTVYFRFYDPRVLRTFLPTCLPGERGEVFGPVDRFLVEDKEGRTALELRRNAEPLGQTSFPMLIVRDAQRDSMSSVTDRPFITRLMEALRAHYPAEVTHLDDSLLQKRITVGLQRARRHGLSSELALACYVTWMFLYSPNFDEHPATRIVLHDRARPDHLRMELVARSVTRNEWATIRKMTRASAWISVDS